MFLIETVISDDVRSIVLKNVKKLSPSELVSKTIVIVDFTIESPRNYPVTKLEKIIRVKYGFLTTVKSRDTVRSRLAMDLVKYTDLINILCNLINEFRKESLDTVICIDYRVVIHNTDCLCREELLSYLSNGNRVFCIKKLGDKYIHVYCSRGEKYVSIKFLKQKPVSTPDPVQLTLSVFTNCGSLSEINNYLLSEVKYNLEQVIKYLY